ncbi:formylglycine-generating enzyme family protein [Leptothoe sp. PORK10 BA2]|uniref:formylglycine-generating enzyme family protein n=1 Tax=Leptothoe sp. PORK10 BA2 TaxID=3110254 RepID=UPI002B1EC1B1|nr:formylglycine-generating enzyme family protein [Leptothoe sp. PORK10 BA2]MEA5467025.1 formylglycine-generating enzyme family protein [Leptothoe sp. PORK10 BA2]
MQQDDSNSQEQQQAQRQVERFVSRFDVDYRWLAYYAALPLVLTPELLHYLRNQFLRHRQLPWIAEADLLLSDLCSPVGYEQYAMDTAVRAFLIKEMEAVLGPEHMRAVAKLLLRYVEHLELMNPYLSRQDLHAQQLAAMVYVDEEQQQAAARQLAQAYQAVSQTGDGQRLSTSAQAEMARLSRLTQELAPKLKAYPQLLDYARVVGRLLTSPKSVPQAALHSVYEVAEGLTLAVPDALKPLEPQPQPLPVISGFPQLEPFDFEHVQLVETDIAEFPPPLQTALCTVITFDVSSDAEDSSDLELFEFAVATLVRQGSPIEWEIQRQQQNAYRWVEPLSEDISLEMVSLPGDTFMMGSPDDEIDRYGDESPQHEVTVEPFWMGRYPITQAQWRVVAAMPQFERELDADPSHFKGDNRPVESVSWHDAVEFCRRLSAHTHRDFGLPTESEWEYACRAGTTTPFHFGETIMTSLANYRGTDDEENERSGSYGDGPKGEFREETTDVDHFEYANVFGLSDMHGNVYEWCQDHWHDNYDGAPTDGKAWESDKKDAYRVMRGGSWFNYPRHCRSAYRDNVTPDYRLDNFGFRVVCSAPRALQ